MSSFSKRHQFYLTLPSNSSVDYYPNNTTANYVTHLPAPITLGSGEWEVALVEAHYPNAFLTVQRNATINVVHELTPGKPVALEFKLPDGSYALPNDLVNALNRLPFIGQYVSFVYEHATRMVTMKVRNHVTDVKMSPALALMLGYDPDEKDLKSNAIAKRPVNTSAAMPAHMYVYCDLVEPQLVGDTVVPLLKIVNINSAESAYGTNNIIHFTDPHYVPVLKPTFESVEMDLRDGTGAKLPFQFGTTCMKLHFRKSATAATSNNE